jgi:hypothetical protein
MIWADMRTSSVPPRGRARRSVNVPRRSTRFVRSYERRRDAASAERRRYAATSMTAKSHVPSGVRIQRRITLLPPAAAAARAGGRSTGMEPP